jgi:ketopantoate reductase
MIVSDRPSIAVVGVGAIGGAMAAALGDAGQAPALCVRTPFEHLSRRLDGETRKYAHRVYADPAELSHIDWILLCTKAHQIASAAHWLRHLIGPDTRVAVMQNGIDHAEGASFPEDFVEKTIERIRGSTGGHWTSMAVGRREGRPMEWQARNAVVGHIGQRHGIRTPLNDALTALLAVIDAPSD